MMGRDLRQIAESQQQLVQAQGALERGYEEKREFDARYRMLLTATRDAFVVLSTSDGRIRDLNAAAATLLGASRDELQGAAFAQEFKDRRRTEFSENLISLAQSDNDSSVAMEAKRTRRNLTLTPTAFRVSGEQMIICRLDTETAAHASNDRLSTNLNALFRSGTDAIVFSDTKGLIDAANEAFLEMVDFGHQSDVRGRNLSEYMARGQIDLDALLENALRSGHMRVYSTKLSNYMGVWTSVEMSVTYLQDGTRPSVAFTIRDVTRAEALRVPATNSGPAAAGNSAVDLVGQAPLKEIVAATSDVVEKMCIETAIELTRNNRAAAAEMLGLSRQSLYVKLRKFGLLDKSDAD